MAKTLNEVIGGVNRALAGDGLHDGQEHLKADPLIWTMLVGQLLHVRLSWVLAKCSQHLPDLGHLNLAITLLVKDAEGLLEIIIVWPWSQSDGGGNGWWLHPYPIVILFDLPKGLIFGTM